MFKIISKKIFVSAVALIVGITVGLSAIPSLANGQINRSQDKAPKFSVNSNGQTYGSAANAISVETEPDLIAAVGIDGTKGYVLSKDLRDEMPKTPKEAVAKTKENEKAVKEAKEKGSNIIREIPLYDVEGKKIIGKFGITGLNKPDESSTN